MSKSFREAVYQTVAKIPKGKVATYKQIAEMTGNSKSARAVGVFMRSNDDLKNVPCHRVVGSNGKLIGYSNGGTGRKKKLLVKEGVHFKGNIVNFAKSQWINR